MSVSPVAGPAPLPDPAPPPVPESPGGDGGRVVRGGAGPRAFIATGANLRELDAGANATQGAASQRAEEQAVANIVRTLQTGPLDWAVTKGDTERVLAELDRLDPAAWLGAVVMLASKKSDDRPHTWLEKLFTRGMETEGACARFAAQCADRVGALVGRQLTPDEGRAVAEVLGGQLSATQASFGAPGAIGVGIGIAIALAKVLLLAGSGSR